MHFTLMSKRDRKFTERCLRMRVFLLTGLLRLPPIETDSFWERMAFRCPSPPVAPGVPAVTHQYSCSPNANNTYSTNLENCYFFPRKFTEPIESDCFVIKSHKTIARICFNNNASVSLRCRNHNKFGAMKHTTS